MVSVYWLLRELQRLPCHPFHLLHLARALQTHRMSFGVDAAVVGAVAEEGIAAVLHKESRSCRTGIAKLRHQRQSRQQMRIN